MSTKPVQAHFGASIAQSTQAELFWKADSVLDQFVPELSSDELQALLQRLDDVVTQAQELQRQLREKMLDRARRDHPAASAATLRGKPRKHKR
jgi:hypothetical protein